MSKKRTILAFALLILISATLPAATTIVTINATGDNFIKGTHQNENEGSKGYFRIQNANISHALVRFSQSQLSSAVGPKYVVSAMLELYVETNFNNWGAGRLVDVHRLTTDWTEGSSTWSCPNDTNLSNNSPDCATIWNGGSYYEQPTASLLHVNQETAWKSFNVTTDVLDFISGASANYGWLLKKNVDSDSGSVDYTSVQGNSANRPRLVLTLDDYAPPTVFDISNVSPFVFEADGMSRTIMISGVGFAANMEVIVDDISTPYVLINPNLISINLNYTTSGRHFLEIENSSGVSSGWPKGIYSIKPGEIVTGNWVDELAEGGIIDVYTVAPRFDFASAVYFDTEKKQFMPSSPTSSMTLAQSTYISENQMEVEVPPGVQGRLAMYIDNSLEADLYQTEVTNLVTQLTAVDLPETSPCTVSDISVEVGGSYSNWRRFKAVTTGCCSRTCAPGKFFGLQYIIDGRNYSEQLCGDTAPLTSTAEWVFPAGEIHSIGARTVEYTYLVDRGSRTKICSRISPITTKNLGRIQRHASDSDADGIRDSVENGFYSEAFPKLVINETQGGEVPHTVTVRIGPGVRWNSAPRMDIVLNYNALYLRDGGCSPFDAHDWDTEPFGYLVQGGGNPGMPNGWQVTRTKTVAHDGTSTQNVDSAAGVRSFIWVATQKNANFLRVCDYTCNRCAAYGTVVTPLRHDVGNGTRYKNCGDAEHLQNGSYKVPEKWLRMLRFFSLRSKNPFLD